jgi:hypothetical protein
MMMASPVFRAMLGGNFSESTRTLDENDPLVLEDDDFEAFKTMCTELHHQSSPEDIIQDLIVEVAIVSDKYSCAARVIQHITTPLRKHVNTIDPGVDAAPPSMAFSAICCVWLIWPEITIFSGRVHSIFWRIHPLLPFSRAIRDSRS